MANPGQIDHVAVGISELPEKLRADRVVRYLSVYLAQFNDIEAAIQQLIEAFLTWQTFGAQLDFVLETIGSVFDQPRPEGFTNDQYAFILGARALSRLSQGVVDNVYRVANYLAQGQPVRIFRLVPKIIVIVFTDVHTTPQQQALYYQILLDSVDAVDRLEVAYVMTGTAFYDFGEYDVELYA